MTTEAKTPNDPWADWLLRGRQQGMSDAERQRLERGLQRLRDRTLGGARLRRGQRVLDAGAGTGLLALDACRRVGPEGAVVALDISLAALQEALRLESGDARATALTAIVGEVAALPFMDASVDAVLTRSVLIYVADKAAAVREFYRVLKPGGRVSIFEPINRAGQRYGDFSGGRDLAAVEPAFDQVMAYMRAHWPHQDAMLDFDERDLVRWFVDAGFNVQLTYEHVEGRGRPLSEHQQVRRRGAVEAGLARRYNPTLMSYAEAAEATLGNAAADHLRRVVDLLLAQPGMGASGSAYLVARRPMQ